MKLIKDLGMKYPTHKSKKKARYGIYECPKCNKHFETGTYSVNAGTSSQCKSCSTIKHGMSKKPIYKLYNKIIERCRNEKVYPLYKNIEVCNEWKSDFMKFYTWAKENGYNEKLTIDRIDNNGNYSPENCRFTDRSTQSQNTRKIRKTNKSGYRGVSWSKSKNAWIAQICVKNKYKYLGKFNTPKEASIAYDNFVRENNTEHTVNGEVTL